VRTDVHIPATVPVTDPVVTTSSSPLPALAGAAAGVGFVLSFLVQGALREGYDPVRHYVSQLSLGPGGWVQVATFVLSGALLVVFAAALRRALAPGRGSVAAPILLALTGLGLVTAGLFPADPGLNGFPPGSTLPPDSPTPSFTVHILSAAVVFFALPAAAFVLARRFRRDPAWRGWAVWTVAAGVVVWALWAGSTVLSGDGSAPIDGVIGLVQRIYLVVAFGWVTAVSVRLSRLVAP
jgi:hypothetical membrane protein